MTARTRVEAADAVVSVQAEGVDQATGKIKEVDKALGKLPGAAKAADAAAAESSKRWQELAGKVGAAVGAFASVQGLDLSSSSGLVGLAGVAATATAALGPLGLAVTAAAAGVNLLVKAFEDSGPASDLFMGQMDAVAQAVQAAAARIDGLAEATGGYLSTLSQREKNQLAEAQAAVKSYTDAAKQAQSDLDSGWTREKEARLEAIEAEKRWAEVTIERLTAVSAARAKERGLAKNDDSEAEARAEKARAAAESTMRAEHAERERQVAFLLAAGEALEAEWARQEEAKRTHDIKMFEMSREASDRERAMMMRVFRGTHAEEKKRVADAIALANAERDAKYAAAGAIVGSARGIAEAVGASQKVILGLQGIEYGILAAGETAKAFASAAVFDYWGATQHGFAAAQAAVASAMAFRGAGAGASGGGGGAAPAMSGGGGGAASVSAPSQARTADSREGGTVVMTFDRLARPLTRGDERAVQRGTRRAIATARTAPLRGSGANA